MAENFFAQFDEKPSKSNFFAQFDEPSTATPAPVALPAPASPLDAPGLATGQEPDPAEAARAAAAARLQRSVRPPGGRQEGALTRTVEAIPPAIAAEGERLGQMSHGLLTGQLPPEPGNVMEAVTAAMPTSAAARTGVGIARAAMAPAEVAAQQIGVTAIPRAAEMGAMGQAIGRGLSAAPLIGTPLRQAAEETSAQLSRAGVGATKLPTGTAANANVAGGQVRAGLEAAKEAAKEEGVKLSPKLNRMLGQSNEDMVGQIATMASVRKGADINTLGQVRRSMTASEWGDVQSSTIERLGRSARTGVFDADTWIRNYGNLSAGGKNLLFGGPSKGNTLRQHLDSLEAVARRAPSWEQFGRKGQTLGTTMGTAALVGAAFSPLTVLQAAVPGTALARWLAKPATAAPLARWSRATEALARSGGAPAALSAFRLATENLKNSTEEDIDWRQLIIKLKEALPDIKIEL